MNYNNLNQVKSSLRTALKQLRADLPADTRQAYSECIVQRLLGLDEIQQANSIFGFISYSNEVHTHDLLKYFLNKNKRLATPKILPDKIMIAVELSSWDTLEAGEMGILTPPGETPFPDKFDVIITPGLGFTRSGCRIGYGRGYYDKWFASHPEGLRIAICFECQLRNEIPTDSNDLPVHLVVTENAVYKTEKNEKILID